MKRIFSILMVVLMLTVLACPVFAEADNRVSALVVYGGTAGTVEAGDKAIGDRLSALGFDLVEYVFAADTTEASADGVDLVYISESVTSADVSTKFTYAESYVIVAEPGLYDEFLIGNYDSTYDQESYSGKYIVANDLVQCGLSEFTGFKADATPGFLLEWGAGVQTIVVNENDAPAVTYAPAGAELFDGSAATGPRSTIFCRGQSAADFTDESWAVFDGLMNLVFPPIIPEATTDTADTSDETVEQISAPQTADPLSMILCSVLISGAAIISRKKR